MRKTNQIIYIIALGISVFIWCGLLITCITDIKNKGISISTLVMFIAMIILAKLSVFLVSNLGFHKNKQLQNENDHSIQTIKPISDNTFSPNDEYEKYIARESNIEKPTNSTFSANDEYEKYIARESNIEKPTNSTFSANDEYEKYIARESNIEKQPISTRNLVNYGTNPQKNEKTERANGYSSLPTSTETTHSIENRVYEIFSENPPYTNFKIK